MFRTQPRHRPASPRAPRRRFRPEAVPLEGRALLSTTVAQPVSVTATGAGALVTIQVAGTFQEIPGGHGLDAGLTYTVTDPTGKPLNDPHGLQSPVFQVPGNVVSPSNDGMSVGYKFTLSVPRSATGGAYTVVVHDVDVLGNGFVATGKANVVGSGVSSPPRGAPQIIVPPPTTTPTFPVTTPMFPQFNPFLLSNPYFRFSTPSVNPFVYRTPYVSVRPLFVFGNPWANLNALTRSYGWLRVY